MCFCLALFVRIGGIMQIFFLLLVFICIVSVLNTLLFLNHNNNSRFVLYCFVTNVLVNSIIYCTYPLLYNIYLNNHAITFIFLICVMIFDSLCRFFLYKKSIVWEGIKTTDAVTIIKSTICSVYNLFLFNQFMIIMYNLHTPIITIS